MIIAIVILIMALEIAAAIMVFALKDIMHSALALSVLFFGNSLAFLFLSQPVLAIIQLLVMVGGISTYIFIGVSSVSYSNFRHTRYAALAALATLIFFLISFPLLIRPTNNLFYGTAMNESILKSDYVSSFAVSPPNYMTANIPFFYLLSVLLFGVALASIVMIKKLGEDK
ncbi:hypothetical protein M1614_03730 [Candidatus Marsarchaeota archaeon]|nr:hypothetical protein [Candidatus Marsarchaeota archaeon]MCL5089608.1 hypothetical protein [Candidatus Marsarchaeota archaeon]